MPNSVRRVVPGVAVILCYALLLNQAAYAAVSPVQDAATQAAQQAQMAAQQAAQQAAQAAQIAKQAAQQAAQQAAAFTPIPQAPSSSAPPLPVPSTGPVPAMVASAHKIFFTNGGAAPNFPVDAAKTYNDVYAELQTWGYYQFVSSPQQADLIFELRSISPLTDVTGDRNGVYPYHTPAFVLTIRDPKSNAVLWTITSPVYLVGRGQKFERWFSLSERNLLSRIKALANQPLTAEETADLTTYPKSHPGPYIALFVGISAAATLTGVLLFKHAENNAKANQDAFCEAHNIPLSMCAGG